MPSGSACCPAPASGTASWTVILRPRRSSVPPCAILRRNAPSRERPGTSSRTGSQPSPWAAHAWMRQPLSWRPTGRRTSPPTSPVPSGSCWVVKCHPSCSSPWSFLRLLRPQAGPAEEQLSSTMTMTTSPFGSPEFAPGAVRWTCPTPPKRLLPQSRGAVAERRHCSKH
jgi:hypothetical protein